MISSLQQAFNATVAIHHMKETAAGPLWGLSPSETDTCAWDQGHHNIHTWIRPQEAARWDPRTKRQRSQQSDERAVRLHRVKESISPAPGQSQRDHPCRDPHHCRDEQTCVSLAASGPKWAMYMCVNYGKYDLCLIIWTKTLSLISCENVLYRNHHFYKVTVMTALTYDLLHSHTCWKKKL